MLIKLTYQGKGTPTLVNLQNVKNIFSILDKRNDKIATKIEYIDGTYVNVEEDIKTIYEIQWKMMNGICDMDFEVPSVDEMINNSYYENGGNGDRHWIGQRTNQPRKRVYRDNYNNQNNY
jgi:hypothetical protein